MRILFALMGIALRKIFIHRHQAAVSKYVACQWLVGIQWLMLVVGHVILERIDDLTYVFFSERGSILLLAFAVSLCIF